MAGIPNKMGEKMAGKKHKQNGRKTTQNGGKANKMTALGMRFREVCVPGIQPVSPAYSSTRIEPRYR